MILSLAASATLGYLLGSVMVAIPISRAIGGVDIRSVGSGNPGFTNVLRAAGRTAGMLTLLADVSKGVIAVLLARAALAPLLGADPLVLGTLACLGAVTGHAFPLYHGLKGGKGVATAAGGFAALEPSALLVAAGVWLLVLVVTRYMSLASIAGALVVAVHLTWFQRPSSAEHVLVPVAWIVALAIVLRHRGNVARLARGQEPRFSLKKR